MDTPKLKSEVLYQVLSKIQSNWYIRKKREVLYYKILLIYTLKWLGNHHFTKTLILDIFVKPSRNEINRLMKTNIHTHKPKVMSDSYKDPHTEYTYSKCRQYRLLFNFWRRDPIKYMRKHKLRTGIQLLRT